MFLSFRFALRRIQFPIWVIESKKAIRNNPGIRMIHQARVIRALSDSESRLPQEITSRGSPIPIKLSVDSATIAARTFIITINMMDEIKFGAR